MRTCPLALLTALVAGSIPTGAHGQGVRVDLAHKGEGYPVYRIPALAVTTRGTLIAAYDGRPSGADVPSNIALVVRRSRDQGATWDAPQLVRADSAPFGFGDPSLLVDRETGRIFLFHAASVRQGFFGSATGTREDDPDVLQADYSWSDDDGATWRHRRITAAIKDPAWGGLFASSGAGIQLRHGAHAGRLLQQYVVRFNGQIYGASAYSDDHGATWRMGALVGPGVDENKTVELADGRVMLNGRAKGVRRVAWSRDGGVTYTGLRDDSTLVDPGNNAAIIRAHPEARAGTPESEWLLFSNTSHRTERRHLTIALSCNSGTRWLGTHTVEPGLAAYSTLAMLPNGKVGVLYERGDYEWISFTTVDTEQLTAWCVMAEGG
jgi:sialidase-1